MRTLITISDELLEIAEKTVLAITFAFVDIRDLTSRFISYSSSLKAPMTEPNRVLLGLPDDIKSTSEIPYTMLEAKCSYDGYEYFKGRLNIEKASRREVTFNIYEQTKDLFDALDGIKLYDVDIAASAWNASDIDAARLATEGAFAPVLNWGRYSSNNIQATYYLPSYFYNEIITKIFALTGYDVDGDIFDSDDFNDLIIPYSNSEFIYNEAYQNERTFSVSRITDELNASTVPFDSVQSDGLYFNSSNSRYEIPSFGSTGDIGRIYTSCYLIYNATGTFTPGDELVFSVIRNGNALDIVADTIINYTGDTFNAAVQFAGNAEFEDSDYFTVFVTKQNLSGPSSSVIIDILIGSTWSGYIGRETYRNYLFHKYLLPNISVYDIIEDFIIRFGIIIKPNTDGTFTLLTLDEILSRKHLAVDMTSNRDAIDEDISFQVDGYSQNNYFNYEEVDGVISTIGQGNLTVSNENIELEDDYYSSIFENTNTEVTENISMASIPVYDGTSTEIDEFVNDPALKILTVRDKIADEPSVTFNATPRADYKVAYFVDSIQTKDTGFQYFIDNYYGKFSASLQKAKVVPRVYNVSVIEFKKITEDLRLIYDDGDYFLVNQIKSFVPGLKTKVELIKIL